ncbi:MAG: bifunctional 4-hydroxy-3-methylbut-2-enyl diphosphate reductase/30S ribosomal protein S1 [Candidatus Fimenecus sp.]
MQKITLAKTAGFCFGVNRAVNLLENLVENGEKACTLGPIIHNPQVISHFESHGVRVIDSPNDCHADETLVVRTHGVEKAVLSAVEESGRPFLNATCPFVTKIHKIVRENSTPENVTLIAGDSRHPEVVGIRSYCNGRSFVFNSYEELLSILENHPNLDENGLILVSQTTFSIKSFKKCVKKIKMVYTNAVIFDTICSATEERQAEAQKLSLENDAMLIIGGRQSSNTAKLKAVCEANCPTFLIETAQELNGIDLSRFHAVGVTAGASTPDSIIKEVLKTMSENLNQTQAELVEKEESAMSSEATSFADMLEEYIDTSSDQKVVGHVVAVTPTEIQVEITGRKHTGYVSAAEYSNDPTADMTKEVKVGDELNLIIMKTNDMEGTVALSKKRYDAIQAWDELSEENEAPVEGKVTGVVGDGKGLFVQYNGIRVFIPASLSKINRNDSLEDMVGQTVSFKIIEVDRRRRRVVGSIRAAYKDVRAAAEEAFWAQAEEGQTYTGTVRSLTSYGAFVDIGGVDGMIHISELSWSRIKHPSDVVKVGDTVEVYIKALDRENKKISLGYKKVEDNPWEILKRDYPVGSVLKAKVVGLTTFGAFANILPGIDGLIHISEISYNHIGNPAEVLKVGDEVEVKLLDVDFDKKRVSLSIKALLDPPAPATEAAEGTPVSIDELAAEAAAEAETEAEAEPAPAEEPAE